jgi:type 2A phosphatase activator TIP41
MRLDKVLVRIRDTRIYVDFGTGQVIRDYTEKEEAFETLKKASRISNSLLGAFADRTLEFACVRKVT